MILHYVILALIILGLSLIVFFMFCVLIPAMKSQGFSVDSLIFSDKEKTYVIQKDAVPQQTENKAVVLCSHEKQIGEQRIHALQGQTCALLHEVYGSLNDCPFSCIGLGDCIKSCPQEAIVIEKNCAVIIRDLCIGCGECIKSCPKQIITMTSPYERDFVLCTANETCMTNCSDFKKTKKIPIISKKGFKFWQKCYKILKK